MANTSHFPPPPPPPPRSPVKRTISPLQMWLRPQSPSCPISSIFTPRSSYTDSLPKKTTLMSHTHPSFIRAVSETTPLPRDAVMMHRGNMLIDIKIQYIHTTYCRSHLGLYKIFTSIHFVCTATFEELWALAFRQPRWFDGVKSRRRVDGSSCLFIYRLCLLVFRKSP